MSALDRIFEQAWDEVSSGRASVEQVTQRYPEHAPELKELLETARRIEAGAALRAPAALRAAGRRSLTAHMASSRSTGRGWSSMWEGVFRRRLAPALAGLALVFTVGTAAAQAADPGDLLYSWRQASEVGYLSISPDKSSAAVTIADRRVQDIFQAPGHTDEYDLAVASYLSWLERIEDQGLLTLEVKGALSAHQVRLRDRGIELPELEEVTEAEAEETLLPTPELIPSLIPTVLPGIEDPLDLID